uniref:PIG-P domain-containing protein n=1 Tax=Strongyloides venezuelensis TaxID=75913 RepID=A0A0K0EWB7_STRVS
MIDTPTQTSLFDNKIPSNSEDVEENPLPDSHRAIYGFAFYILNWISFIIYLIWVLTPYTYLEYLNLTFLPSKYYGLCLPLLIPFGITVFIGGILIYNILKFQEMDDEKIYLKDDFAQEYGDNF